MQLLFRDGMGGTQRGHLFLSSTQGPLLPGAGMGGLPTSTAVAAVPEAGTTTPGSPRRKPVGGGERSVATQSLPPTFWPFTTPQISLLLHRTGWNRNVGRFQEAPRKVSEHLSSCMGKRLNKQGWGLPRCCPVGLGLPWGEEATPPNAAGP